MGDSKIPTAKSTEYPDWQNLSVYGDMHIYMYNIKHYTQVVLLLLISWKRGFSQVLLASREGRTLRDDHGHGIMRI